MDISNKKVGFIGFGNMAAAICDGLLAKEVIDNDVSINSIKRYRLISSLIIVQIYEIVEKNTNFERIIDFY